MRNGPSPILVAFGHTRNSRSNWAGILVHRYGRSWWATSHKGPCQILSRNLTALHWSVWIVLNDGESLKIILMNLPLVGVKKRGVGMESDWRKGSTCVLTMAVSWESWIANGIFKIIMSDIQSIIIYNLVWFTCIINAYYALSAKREGMIPPLIHYWTYGPERHVWVLIFGTSSTDADDWMWVKILEGT